MLTHSSSALWSFCFSKSSTSCPPRRQKSISALLVRPCTLWSLLRAIATGRCCSFVSSPTSMSWRTRAHPPSSRVDARTPLLPCTPTTTAFYISFRSRGRKGWRLWKIGAPVALTPRGTATGEYACACVRACVRFYVKYSYPKHCACAFLCASMLCMLIAFRWNRCNKESGGANRLRASGLLFQCIPQLAHRSKGTVVA